MNVDIEERRERVAAMTRQGHTARHIAVALGVTERTVGRDRAAMGVAQPVPIPVTEAQMSRAYTLLVDGCSYADAARTVGLHPRTVIHHLPGYGWTPEYVREWARFIQQSGRVALRTQITKI